MANLEATNPPSYHSVCPRVPLQPRNLDALKSTKSNHRKDLENHEERDQETRKRGDKKRRLEKRTSLRGALLVQGTRVGLREFCQNTTAHGFSHVVESNVHVVLRLFWLVVTFVSLGVLLCLSYEVTHSAFVTKRPYTDVTYYDNRSSGLPFPDITICSLSGFWKSKLEAHQVDASLASYLLVAVGGPDVASPSLKTDPRRVKTLQNDLNAYLMQRNITLTQMITLLSPTCEDIIMGCFTDTDALYSTECCQKLFTQTVTTVGLCHTTLGYNTSKHTQTIAGLTGGQRIVFRINLNEYMEYDARVVSTMSLAESGVHVSLSSFDLNPTVAANVHAIRVAPNTSASVALTVTKIDHTERHSENWPWSSRDGETCLREAPYRLLTMEEQAYTQNNLYFTLLYRRCLLRLANCSAVALRFNNDTTSECLPDQILYNLIANGAAHDCLRQELESYNDRVRKLCHTTSIKRQLSYNNIMTESFREIQWITDITNKTLSMVNIYYSQLGYAVYTERMPTFSTWFSNLGGQMGLFLGASFITLMELCFVVFYVLKASAYKGFVAACVRFKSTTMATRIEDPSIVAQQDSSP